MRFGLRHMGDYYGMASIGQGFRGTQSIHGRQRRESQASQQSARFFQIKPAIGSHPALSAISSDREVENRVFSLRSFRFEKRVGNV